MLSYTSQITRDPHVAQISPLEKVYAFCDRTRGPMLAPAVAPVQVHAIAAGARKFRKLPEAAFPPCVLLVGHHVCGRAGLGRA